MRFDPNGSAYIAESKEDFNGWQILTVEDYKPGVKRVRMRRNHSFMIIYADEAIAPDVTEQPRNLPTVAKVER